MGKGEIKSDKEVLQKIFSQDFWFVIPEYQRPYVWQKENVEELIEDLYFAFENKADSEYFLGSLVLKKTRNKDYSEYEVLDGQQRLSTFFMMLAVIRDLLEIEGYKETIRNMLYQEKNELLNTPTRERITYLIRDNVEDFIDKYILEEGKTFDIESLQQLSKSDNTSISNMASAVIVIKEMFDEKDDLMEFTKFLLNKALFIYVSTDNTEDAFRLFTILNDRGIPLTCSDILKSINVGELNGKRELKKYSKRWEAIEGKYGDNFDKFLMLVRSIIVKQKASGNVLDEFQRNIYEKGRLKKGIETIELISKYDEIYDDIIELYNKKLSNSYKNLITIMKVGIESQEWIPSLMYYYNKFNIYMLETFLKKLEYKFVGDWINQETPSKRIENMNKIMKELEYTSRDELDEFFESDLFNIDKESYKVAISGDIYRKRYCKYLLLKLEYLMSDDTVHISGYKTISVEHILPQNPGDKSQWMKDFNEESRKLWTNKIANLVLVSKRKNSKLSNLDYEEKKKRYLNDRVDAFKASKIFLDSNNKWNVKILDKRQKNLVNMLINNEYISI